MNHNSSYFQDLVIDATPINKKGEANSNIEFDLSQFIRKNEELYREKILTSLYYGRKEEIFRLDEIQSRQKDDAYYNLIELINFSEFFKIVEKSKKFRY